MTLSRRFASRAASAIVASSARLFSSSRASSTSSVPVSSSSLFRSLFDSSARVVEQLSSKGYAIVDDGIDPEGARILLDEMKALRADGAFVENKTVFTKAGEKFELVKPNVLEFEAHNASAARKEIAPTFAALADDASFMNRLNLKMRWDEPTRALVKMSVKLQVNAGNGGCFPIHFDSDASLDSRRLTVLSYLNENWAPGDGGELVLYPFPREKVTVEPKFGRVVLFSSQFGLHRVLPSNAKERFMFTMWCFASTMQEPRKMEVPGSDAMLQLRGLLSLSIRKHLAKVVLADEWATSIVEAHADDDARTVALQTHWDEVELITKVLTSNFPLGLEKLAKVIEKSDAEVIEKVDMDWFPL